MLPANDPVTFEAAVREIARAGRAPAEAMRTLGESLDRVTEKARELQAGFVRMRHEHPEWFGPDGYLLPVPTRSERLRAWLDGGAWVNGGRR